MQPDQRGDRLKRFGFYFGWDILVNQNVLIFCDMHALCVLDEHAHIVFEGRFAADDDGYAQIEGVLVNPDVCACVAIEGVTSYGYGIASYLKDLGFEVKEALRPGARPYNPGGKTDEIDAHSAARSAFLGSCPGAAKQMAGDAQRLSFLVSARDSAVKEATAISNAVQGLLVRAPHAIRERYRGMKPRKLMDALCRARPSASDAPEIMRSLKSLARRWKLAMEEEAELAEAMACILNASYADLLSAPGVGVVTAAVLVSHIGDNPARFSNDAQLARAFGAAPIPASSGKTTRHRLNRGGDRQANRAIHTIAINRIRSDERTKAYMDKKMSEGKTKREAIRCLKRFIVREIFSILCRDERGDTSQPPLRKVRTSLKITLKGAAEALGTKVASLSRIERSLERDLELEAQYWEWLWALKTVEDLS